MSILGLLGLVAAFGAVGGLVNGVQINYLRSNLSQDDPADMGVTDQNQQVALTNAIAKEWGERPLSVIFNLVAGAVSAAASWAAYGPYAVEYVIGGPTSQSGAPEYGLTLAALSSAVVIGFGGPRWLTNERDKALLRQAADDAAGTPQSETKRKLMQRADPKQKSRIAGINIGA